MKECILAFFGSLFLAILINVDRKKFFWVGLPGSLGWAAYAWLLDATREVIFATFVGAVVVGVYSEIAARKLKSPATVFSISGAFPLVPGVGAYNTVQMIVEGDMNGALGTGIETIASAAAIAAGIMLASAIFRIMKRPM